MNRRSLPRRFTTPIGSLYNLSVTLFAYVCEWKFHNSIQNLFRRADKISLKQINSHQNWSEINFAFIHNQLVVLEIEDVVFSEIKGT